MWIHVRSSDGQKSVRLSDLSKLTKIEDVRFMIAEEFEDALPERQRLFFGGKQLEDGHTLFDYNVGLNDTIQLIVRPLLQDEATRASDFDPEKGSKKLPSTSEKDLCDEGTAEEIEEGVDASEYYKIGDFVDTCVESDGSWFEADLVKIVRDKKEGNAFLLDDQGNALNDAHDGYKYYVKFIRFHPEDSPVACHFGALRPRSWKLLKSSDIAVGETVLANYNIEEPKKIGHWYDIVVTSKDDSRTVKNLVATVIVGATKLGNMNIHRVSEFFRIEKPVKLAERNNKMEHHMQISAPPKRDMIPDCSHCKDDLSRLCKQCSCRECGSKDHPSQQLICDECQMAFHIYCLTPPLDTIPEDDWYCNDCRLDTKEVVNAGEKLKESKKKSKMPSQMDSGKKRDWGKGMACQGRENVCTIVPGNHFGPIPGVEVGSSWRYRLQASTAGVHRPPVSGISGRANEGAYSIVLSGGYDDDKDDGDEFLYTGSGGRDLTGNRRTARQSCDQELTKANRALAVCCNASVSEKGATAKDWRGGKQVRVVRKQTPHSKYAPKEGLRYDGIYKVVRYWSEVGKSGFKVWKYEFRRDDPTPAPWTDEGKKRIKALGLTMQNPIGYEDKIAANDAKKRTSKDDHKETSAEKRTKVTTFKLSQEVLKLISLDQRNEETWKECLKFVSSGQEPFIGKVKEEFNCIVCQDVVVDPVIMVCGHNTCKSCLQRALKADVSGCPVCRHAFEKDFEIKVNKKLANALKTLFTGSAWEDS